ncbi:hypothetical protein ABGB19_13810 [Mycobacterium sp. B14F4]|uniref:hypothetical protein n=1 Tax=Mycobacterium sp. B14F4 TaxID=3153565 RepID=UPI00325CC00C
MTPAPTAGGDWLRSPPARALLWASLLMSLILGVSLVTVTGSDPLAPGQSDRPLDDDEAVAQVVSAARGIISAAGLQQTTGGYSFQSCATTDAPPFQAVLYATFLVPEGDPARYLHAATEAMTARGWTRSPVVGERFGENMTKDGVAALINRDATAPGFAAMRLYGECRNWGPHREDDPAWTEVDL